MRGHVTLVAAFLLLPPVAWAQEVPVLVDLQFQPDIVSAGTTTQLAIQVDGAIAIEAVFIVRDDGTSVGLNWQPTGSPFTVDLPIPSNTINAGYHIRELGVVGTDGAIYRFLYAADFGSEGDCPNFTNIGIWACYSTELEDLGHFTVVDGIDQPDPPELTGISYSAASTNPGDTLTVSFEVTNVTSVANAFLERPAGTSGGLPWQDLGCNATGCTAEFQIPTNAATGTWVLKELGFRNEAGEEYRFLESIRFAGTTPCPDFQDIGLPTCASTVLTDHGQFHIGGSNFPLPNPELVDVSIYPLVAPPGSDVTLEIRLTNVDRVYVFGPIRPDGTYGNLEWQLSQVLGDLHGFTLHVPEGTAEGEWRVREMGAFNDIEEEYRFLDSAWDPYLTNCIDGFGNFGLFACGSDLVRDFGSFFVGQILTPAEQVAEIEAVVDELLEAGQIEPQTAAALSGNLDQARRLLEQARALPASKQLEAFVRKVQRFTTLGKLTASQGEHLQEMAIEVLELLDS